MREFSISLFSRLRNFVLVMLMTLPPLSGQALLHSKESPTSATNSISSKTEGWKIPWFFSMKDMKKVLP